jgi:hypothetical protein
VWFELTRWYNENAPIHYAFHSPILQSNDTNLIYLLCQDSLDINIIGQSNRTLFHYACTINLLPLKSHQFYQQHRYLVDLDSYQSSWTSYGWCNRWIIEKRSILFFSLNSTEFWFFKASNCSKKHFLGQEMVWYYVFFLFQVLIRSSENIVYFCLFFYNFNCPNLIKNHKNQKLLVKNEYCFGSKWVYRLSLGKSIVRYSGPEGFSLHIDPDSHLFWQTPKKKKIMYSSLTWVFFNNDFKKTNQC